MGCFMISISIAYIQFKIDEGGHVIRSHPEQSSRRVANKHAELKIAPA